MEYLTYAFIQTSPLWAFLGILLVALIIESFFTGE